MPLARFPGLHHRQVHRVPHRPPLAAEHAINVHESDENIQNYIACGELTGTPTEGLLQIQLSEQNDSGYQGMAALQDNGDGTYTSTIDNPGTTQRPGYPGRARASRRRKGGLFDARTRFHVCVFRQIGTLLHKTSDR